MMKQHWSSMQQNDIKEFKINRTGFESLYMGCGDTKDFVFVDAVSDELYDKLENENVSSNLTSYDNDKSISLTIYNENDIENKLTPKIARSLYIKLFDDKKNNRKYVRIYFKYDNDLLNMLKNKEYSKIEITTNKYVDIGPSFKDDFLTTEAIKQIKKYHKNKKENEKIDWFW